MTTQTDMFEKMRQELERTWKRTEAAVNFALKPQTAQVGQSPKEVIWSKNKAKLYRYHAQGEIKHAVPILLVCALINRSYILDLTPGNSFVEFLVSEGYDVYAIDWGTPGEEDAGMRLEDYVLDYIPRAAKQVLKTSGASEFTLLGYCQGGAMSLLYAAAHPEAPLKNLILLTTPVDFSNAGLYSAWLNPQFFNVDRVVDTFGVVPAAMIDMGGKMHKPLQNYTGTYMTLFDKMYDESFIESWLPMNQWVNDGVPFVGEAYRQWVKDFYQGNKLVKGEVKLAGKPVKLENIRCAVLNVQAELDHIVPASQSDCLLDLVGSTDKEQMMVKAGHVGVVVGRGAKKNFFPRLNEWLAKRSSNIITA
jgi:polyhydroxyalkanoate synthase